MKQSSSLDRAWNVRRLQTPDERQLDELASVLVDCVEGGASVSFMLPVSREKALGFWRRVADDVATGRRVLLVAEDAAGICGTVQLAVEQPENQPHRAEVAKMLVHRRARRQGLGAALMRAAEATARECGKTLLVLDTATEEAARLYERLGWMRAGDIPGYCLLPSGELSGTTFFYRDLGDACSDPRSGDLLAIPLVADLATTLHFLHVPPHVRP